MWDFELAYGLLCSLRRVLMISFLEWIPFCQILFKSRCDIELNEVKERVATERREVCILSSPS